MHTVSFSQYSMWKRCKYQWKLQYIDKIKVDEPNLDFIFGSAIHMTLQKYLETFYNKTEKDANAIDLNNTLLSYMLSEMEKYGDNISKFINKDDISSYYLDGIKILDYFKKHKSNYFYKRGHELVGIEEELNVNILPGVNFIGKLDIVIKDKRNNIIKIVDFKKSYRGWNKSQKDDPIKRGQLQLYKQFYSEIKNMPLHNIEIQFLILKQKIFEGGEFKPKRIQIYSPPSAPITLKKVKNDFLNFINAVYVDGNINPNADFTPSPSAHNCKYCPFKYNKDLCSYGVSQ